MNKIKGISLITLVITIVVLVILVGAIVLSISNNNPINQAQRAAIMQDITSMIDQYDLIYVTELGKYNGDKTKIENEAFAGVVPTKYQADFIANKDGLEYNCKDELVKIVIKEIDTEKVILACEKSIPTVNNITVENVTETTAQITIDAIPADNDSTIFRYKYSIDGGNIYQESNSNIITITDLTAGVDNIVKIKVVDSKGRESTVKEGVIKTKITIEGIKIPQEFYYVGGTKDTGIVISDNSEDAKKGSSHEVSKALVGNQYVWIPVASDEEFIRREWNKGEIVVSCCEPYEKGWATEISEYNEMKAKVVANQGFYIARYEASNGGGTAESKGLKMPWNNIAWGTTDREPISGTASYEGRHASEKLGYTNVQSTLIYGVEWDSALKFIENTGINVVDSTSWGNYNNANFNYTNENNIESVKSNNADLIIPTGASEYTMKQNIYDMAGNLAERTMEAHKIYPYCIYRGGAYYNFGDKEPASYRNLISPNAGGDYAGFRVALYIK